MDQHSELERIAVLAAGARRIFVSTGAGISAESGIPTFRDAQTGLWARYDPVMLASYEGFIADPQRVWRWYDERRESMARCAPNHGHAALARWQKLWLDSGRSFTLATQNIDGLHARAGSTEVLELHGNIWYARPLNGDYALAQRLPDPPLAALPPLDEAGHVLRPHVVWFGESLDEDTLERAFAAASQADLVLVVGSSSQVYPAAALPHAAQRHGATIVEINPEQTELSALAHCCLRGPSGEILPALFERIEVLI